MNKRCIIVCCVMIIMLMIGMVGFAACDSSSGRADEIRVQSYRSRGDFVLPIKVQKASVEPGPTYFKSRLTLSEIYERVSKDGGFETEWVNNLTGVLVRDLSDKGLGYCLIHRCDRADYNFVATSMGCDLYTEDNVSYDKEILVPYHLAETDAEGKIKEGVKYKLTGSKEGIKDFYTLSGFTVSDTADGVLAQDTKITDSDMTPARYVTNLKIIFDEGNVMFENADLK